MFPFSILFALVIAVTLGTGVWLLLRLTAIANLFSGKADLVPSRRRPRASRRRVLFMLFLFVLGLIATITLQIVAMNSDRGGLL